MRYFLIVILIGYSCFSYSCESEEEMFSFIREKKEFSNDELVKISTNSIHAQVYLGMRFAYGEKYGIDRKKAEYWLLMASENGCIFADAELGYLYFQGIDEDPDYKKSFEHLLRAEGFSPLVNIGIADSYAKGWGGEHNPQKAIEYLSSELSMSHPVGLFTLGLMYLDWEGVKPDYEKAENYIRKSALLGYDEGQTVLGYMYHYGIGIEQSYEEAEKWYKKAADQGYFYAKLLKKVAENRDEGFSINDEELKREFLNKVISGEL